jgi:hypothetical protein
MPLTYRDQDRRPMPSEEVPSIWRAERPRTVVVNGQEFLVRPRPDDPGTYDFDWTSGPNEGYGFGISGWRGRPLLPAEIEEHIRSFLHGINPQTGYMD